MSEYPEGHHPVFFLINALKALGAEAIFVRDERTLNCWGMEVNGKLFVWLVDNRLDHEKLHEDPAAAELMRRGVVVASAQRPDAERTGTRWLPLAASPGYRPPDKPVEKLFDISFTGYIRDEGRAQALGHLARHFSVSISQGVFGDSAVSNYWQGRVGFNISMGLPGPTAYDVPMRVTEVMATGTPLVTNYLPELDMMGIKGGSHCVTYSDLDEMIAVVRYMVDRPDEAREMGEYAAEEIAAHHTYRRRAEKVLSWLDGKE